MKIDGINQQNKQNIMLGDKEIKTSEQHPLEFNNVMRKTEQGYWHDRLNQLIKEIDKQGKILSERLNLKELGRYKKLLKDFMEEIVNHGYKLKEQHSWDRRGRHKVYSLIENVNQKLTQLGEEVMQENKDQIKILGLLDEIRGLLVDMYL